MSGFDARNQSNSRPLLLALGPTNTGKTHRAIERMLEHDSGMIGLPLRLLAREVYDKVTAQIGERRVALVTGEEKRVPERPDYWICTVEAMPRNVEVDFLAVDEIQLLTHPQRGHVFSDRLLHSRGRLETWFLGSHTALGLLKQLLPAATTTHRPRLSRLSYAGPLTLGKLPPRTAIVAFNTAQVYEVAERVRARSGGAAVILGALSPRTRNAQVAMFQAGEVATLVATDAIGMGLNLSLQHVAFAALQKFDGQQSRPLAPAELAQIAGRAGRHTADGTFGTLEPCRNLPEGLARQIEMHALPADVRAEWRNSDLSFESLDGLTQSLAQKPRHPLLRLVASAPDTAALSGLSQRPLVRSWARGQQKVELLWQVCQVPDYRKLLPEAHAELLFSVYAQLCGPEGQISEDWLRERVDRLDDVDGDLESLLSRLAFVRTWTYVAHQPGWVAHAESWQAATRELEDRLSDALHDRLVQRFVERTRKHAVALRPPVDGKATKGKAAQHGKATRGSAARTHTARDHEFEASSSGNPFAKLESLRRSLIGAAVVPSAPAFESFLEAAHESFSFDSQGRITVLGKPLAKLRQGRGLLEPELQLDADFAGGEQLRLERRLRAFVRDWLAELLEPLRESSTDSAAVRGILYQLRQNLGTLPASAPASEFERLSTDERKQLCARGIETGPRFAFARPLLEPAALRARALLSAIYFSIPLDSLPQPETQQGPKTKAIAERALLAAGYATVGALWMRCDSAQANVSSGIGKRKRRRRRPRVRANPQ